MALTFLDDDEAATATALPASRDTQTSGVTFLDEEPAAGGMTFLDDEPRHPERANSPIPEEFWNSATPSGADISKDLVQAKQPDAIETGNPAELGKQSDMRGGFFPSLAATAAEDTINSLAAVKDFQGAAAERLSYSANVGPKLSEAHGHLERALDKIGTDEGHASYIEYLRARKGARETAESLRSIGPADFGAKEYRDAAALASDAYDVDPNAQNASAQVGRGIGHVLAAAPTMVMSLPVGVAQMAGTTYQATYGATERELREKGETDETKIADEAQQRASAETVKQAPSLAAYMLGGKLASGLVAKLLPEASPILRGIVGATAATGSNVAIGGATRAGEALAEGKPANEVLAAVVPNLERNSGCVLGTVSRRHGSEAIGSRAVSACWHRLGSRASCHARDR